MRSQYLLLCIAFCVIANTFVVEAKTVFRRTDKISENFKKLDLPADEIDPNVAPPEPQKVETIDPDDADVSVGTVATALADEVIDEADETASAVAAVANEVVDEAANEIENSIQPTVAPAASAVAVSVPAASASAAAATSVPVAAEATPIKNQDDLSPINRYCKCADNHCDCCRNFNLPLIPVRGPGCAKITYLGNEKMSVSIKYGDITLATRTISSKSSKPICVGLPGGYSKFCGRVYGLSKAQEDFKACLGFELRAEDEVEAALRVSCFKFGPEGLRVAEPEPLPSEVIKDEEDDDDIFGFAAGGDDDDDDYDEEDDEAEEADEADEADEEDDAEENDDDEAEAEAPEAADYGGFSLGGLLDELDDDDDETVKPLAAPVAAAVVPAAGSTRTAVQSKDDKGTEAAAIAAAAAEEASGIVEAAITPAPAAAAAALADGATTVKSKKSKKAKKNKKKKTAATTEDGFAYQILNGILDFFN